MEETEVLAPWRHQDTLSFTRAAWAKQEGLPRSQAGQLRDLTAPAASPRRPLTSSRSSQKPPGPLRPPSPSSLPRPGEKLGVGAGGLFPSIPEPPGPAHCALSRLPLRCRQTPPA